MIETAIEAVEKEQACVFAVPVKDTIKVSGESGYAVETPDRSTLWSVQTPQNFSYRLIMEAYQNYFCARDLCEIVVDIVDDGLNRRNCVGELFTLENCLLFLEHLFFCNESLATFDSFSILHIMFPL